MFLILFLPWLLLILPVWIDSGLWENYPKVFRYPARYIHGNSYLHQVRQSSTTRSVFSAPEHHLYSTSSSTLRTRESKITVPYFPRSSYNSAINLIHASKSFSTCISHTNMVNSNPVRTHLHNTLWTCFWVLDNPPSSLSSMHSTNAPIRPRYLVPHPRVKRFWTLLRNSSSCAC
jgi:hypothetical protein